MLAALPSWSDLARTPLQSAAPALWEGLLGLWCPGLGPEGTGVSDLSGRRNHGTLTGTRRAVGPGGWTIALETATDRLMTSLALPSLGRWSITVAFWQRGIGVENPYPRLWDFDDTNRAILTSLLLTLQIGGLYAFSNTDIGVTQNSGNVITITADGSNVVVYRNAVQRAASSIANTTLPALPLAFGNHASGVPRALDCMLTLAAVHTRPLRAQEVDFWHAEPLRLISPRWARPQGVLGPIGGPYRLLAAAAFSPGAAAGQSWRAGAARGQTFTPGPVAGMTDG